jgi:hypothetical protein
MAELPNRHLTPEPVERLLDKGSKSNEEYDEKRVERMVGWLKMGAYVAVMAVVGIVAANWDSIKRTITGGAEERKLREVEKDLMQNAQRLSRRAQDEHFNDPESAKRLRELAQDAYLDLETFRLKHRLGDMEEPKDERDIENDMLLQSIQRRVPRMIDLSVLFSGRGGEEVLQGEINASYEVRGTRYRQKFTFTYTVEDGLLTFESEPLPRPTKYGYSTLALEGMNNRFSKEEVVHIKDVLNEHIKGFSNLSQQE